ncbi:MAG TPA: peptidoglycan editing factor PgeF [Casimicrobiaceae bacterium]|nr:peptidoglycan editing factor PgeF [Casimicrobiaceae bacterium]
MRALQTRLDAEGLDWLIPAWDAPRNVHALVTTRNDNHDRFDLGPARLDALGVETRESVVSNRERVRSFLPSMPIWIEQTHGRDVAIVTRDNLADIHAQAPVADAALTRLPDIPLAVRVADCLPILFTTDDGSIVAATHAGWRGLAAGVIEATLVAMRAPRTQIHAWLGPAIGRDAFEVGADVRDAFCDITPSDAEHFRALDRGKWLADLVALARARLKRAGVDAVAGANVCTHTDSRRFFSYRRDRTAARFAAIVWRE